jgi:hypothetical protein
LEFFSKEYLSLLPSLLIYSDLRVKNELMTDKRWKAEAREYNANLRIQKIT